MRRMWLNAPVAVVLLFAFQTPASWATLPCQRIDSTYLVAHAYATATVDDQTVTDQPTNEMEETLAYQEAAVILSDPNTGASAEADGEAEATCITAWQGVTTAPQVDATASVRATADGYYEDEEQVDADSAANAEGTALTRFAVQANGNQTTGVLSGVIYIMATGEAGVEDDGRIDARCHRSNITALGDEGGWSITGTIRHEDGSSDNIDEYSDSGLDEVYLCSENVTAGVDRPFLEAVVELEAHTQTSEADSSQTIQWEASATSSFTVATP